MTHYLPNPSEMWSTIDTIAKLQVTEITGPDGRKYACHSNDTTLTALTDRHELPAFISASPTLIDRASFASYVCRFKTPDSLIFADLDKATLSAHLDYHKPNEITQHNAHRALFKLEISEEFERWNAMCGTLVSQREFAQFLEQNYMEIEGEMQSAILDISRDLEATQTSDYKSSTRLENGDRAFAFEDKTTPNITVPDKFNIRIPLFYGEPAITATVLLRYSLNKESGLKMGINWYRIEYLRHSEFARIAQAVEHDTGLQCLYGSYASRHF